MMAQRPSEVAAERPLKDLFSELSGELSFLVSREVELAKTELQEKASLAAKGGGALAVGGVAALVGVVMLSLAAAWGLAEVIPTGFAFLIVAVIWLVVAAVMATSGKKQLSKMKPPAPEQALSSMKQDIQVAKTSLSRGVSGSLSPPRASGVRRR